MTRLLALLCLLLFAVGPARAGLFHKKKQAPRATYGVSKEKQRKQAAKARASMRKQHAKAVKKSPAVRTSESKS